MTRLLRMALPATLFVGAIAVLAPQQATAAHPYGSSSFFYGSPGYSRVVVVGNPYASASYFGPAVYAGRHYHGGVPCYASHVYHGPHRRLYTHGFVSSHHGHGGGHRGPIRSHHGSSGHHGSGLHIGFNW